MIWYINNYIFLFLKVKFVKIVCGYTHQAALDQFGKLYTWGDSTDGVLGHSTKQGDKKE